MKPVRDFYEDNPNVIAHGQQQFLECLCLERSPLAEDASGYFGQSFNDVGDFFTKEITDIFVGIVCVFFNVMQECGTDGGGA